MSTYREGQQHLKGPGTSQHLKGRGVEGEG